MVDVVALGIFLRIIREERGLTQSVVAELIGLSEKAIRNIENGESEPKLNTVLKMCDVYQIPGSEIMYFYSRSKEMEYLMKLFRIDTITEEKRPLIYNE